MNITQKTTHFVMDVELFLDKISGSQLFVIFSYKSEMFTLLDESETKRIVVILYKNTIVMY